MKNISVKKIGIDLQRLILPICLLLMIAGLEGCKKKPDLPKEEPPMETPNHGQVLGEITEQTIGASGGQLATADGNVKLVVPPGALDNDVKISIQEVSNTIGKVGVGRAYRLLPETVKFLKDVELTFGYTDADYSGTRRELLYMAYQTTDGKWHKTNTSVYNTTQNLVSVKTRHFSDWSIYAGAKIVHNIGKDELFARDVAKLEVISVEPPKENNDDDLLYPVVTAVKIKRWSQSGSSEHTSGQLINEGESATYIAPNEITSGGELEIIAYLDMTSVQWDPKRPYPDFVYFLRDRMILLPDEFIYWDRYGSKVFSQTVEKSFIKGKMDIKGLYNSETQHGQTVRIFCATPTQGIHKFAGRDDAYVTHYISGFYSSSIYECEYVEKYEKGSVLITKVEDGYIEGLVSGNLHYTDKPCIAFAYDKMFMKFRIKKT
ncbi:hypothetical protein [Pedobacter frigoris]|uniref:ZU5 domain-containing protein n=1 Tax=Pedobacter frigoris TaxID=2571272 RepID=A0A4U1CMA3_9SPHI|nr:hypothetical protein [Pedobacter frigoris]TKC07491.1 hypothetical protein FA047_09600 [Pedobacter frigoris]